MKYRTLVVCPPDKEKYVFPSVILEEIRQLTDCPWPVLDPANWRNAKPALKEADIIFSTRGMPLMSEEFLAAAPVLKAVFYAAGTLKGSVTDEGWDRGIIVSSAWAANRVPVAEYTLATILLSLKRFWHFSRASRSDVGQPEVQTVPGAYHTKVGLISMGAVGRATARLLQPFDFTLLAYDPFFSPKLASELNIGLVPLVSLDSEQRNRSLQVVLPRLAHVHAFHWLPANPIDRRPLAEGADLWRGWLGTMSAAGRNPDCLLEFVQGDLPAHLEADALVLSDLLSGSRRG